MAPAESKFLERESILHSNKNAKNFNWGQILIKFNKK